MSLEAPVLVGWVECKLETCDMMFFRHPLGHRCYGLSDKIGVCPICIFDRKSENGTLPKRKGNVSEFVDYKYTDSKPGIDTL